MKKASILLVEDNEGDILLIKDAFEDSKIKAILSVVKNGQEALDILYKNASYSYVERPDIILLDINIPIISGHDVLKHIKVDSSLKKIPVIMLTTSSNPKDINLAYENYANSYIVKPLNMDDLIKAILQIEEYWLQLSELAD